MAFAGPADGWAAYTGKLYATHDGGATWERLSPGLTDYASTMAFGDAQHGVAISGHTMLFTADGGRTWPGQPLKGLSVAAADSRPDGHIWPAGHTDTGVPGEDGVLLHSQDHGRTWTVYRAAAFGPDQIAFTSATDGGASGTQADIGPSW